MPVYPWKDWGLLGSPSPRTGNHSPGPGLGGLTGPGQVQVCGLRLNVTLHLLGPWGALGVLSRKPLICKVGEDVLSGCW